MMDLTGKHSQSRRQFLRRATQGGVLVALGGVVALAVRGRGVILPGNCPTGGLCGGCALLARCGLPAATTARESVSKSS
jgi:hypothetical protein